MDYAEPRYELPSRHFFSRKAIPALHQHVKERIVHALRQSVSTKVHLTTDAWTSRHGQGRYVSITAHWVNVVDAGSTVDINFGTVLPSPRSRKQLAVGVRTPSSSSFCRSESSSTDRSRPTTPSAAATVAHQLSHYGPATGKHQQAVLAMKCLGDNRHTAEVLSEFLQRETQSWLGTVDLEAGKEDENLDRKSFIIKETVCPKSENVDLSKCDFKVDGAVKICSLDLGVEGPEGVICISHTKDIRVKRSSRKPCRKKPCRPKLTGGYTLIGRPGKNQNEAQIIQV
ncbi:unnamed protein product [Ranitomeya imitator]|uniref:Zinc finger protein n=1 Tax=Ranitomeya imitator TaxID=111125 RepID=A0ABN9LCC6_9NEOB|nr:unnamed protein product [Ranitomeya imitator]